MAITSDRNSVTLDFLRLDCLVRGQNYAIMHICVLTEKLHKPVRKNLFISDGVIEEMMRGLTLTDCCFFISRVAIQSIERKRYSFRFAIPSVGLSVCLCVRKVYCGKTADWIRMPFGVVSEIVDGRVN